MHIYLVWEWVAVHATVSRQGDPLECDWAWNALSLAFGLYSHSLMHVEFEPLLQEEESFYARQSSADSHAPTLLAGACRRIFVFRLRRRMCRRNFSRPLENNFYFRCVRRAIRFIRARVMRANLLGV